MPAKIRSYHEVDELPSDLPVQMAVQDERVRARLASVGRTVAVMSGKGGVGKSLIAALLATALARRGDRVGLIDADLGGPTAAQLLGVEAGGIVEGADGIEPPTSADGVRLMSMGLLLETDRALTWREPSDAGFVWRGTLERGALREFVADVAWGPLDVLLVDLPPGTERLDQLHGLVPNLAGAVAITIPSRPSRDAVARSLDLARRRGIGLLGVVENMSGILCEGCGTLTPLHAGEAGAKLAQQFALPLLGRIPFDRHLAEAAESGGLGGWLASGRDSAVAGGDSAVAGGDSAGAGGDAAGAGGGAAGIGGGSTGAGRDASRAVLAVADAIRTTGPSR